MLIPLLLEIPHELLDFLFTVLCFALSDLFNLSGNGVDVAAANLKSTYSNLSQNTSLSN
jgi:hypothetical protein